MIGEKKMNYTEPDLTKSALVTIDTQRDFSLPGAPAEIAGTLDVIPNMVRLLTAYRHCGLPIIHIVRLYRTDGSNVDLSRRGMIEQGTRIVEPGTDGAELVPALKPSPGARLDADLLLKGAVQQWEQKEFVIYKSRWGAFYDTPLHDHLYKRGVNTLVVCGCNFPNCPRTTIYEASERDYRVVLVEDAVSGIYKRGKEELHNIGVHLLPTDTLIQRLGTINETAR
ncbi:MAG: cysteine hydrolase [Deltaproteobacteria bacterium]|nr:cysteine hydrolase [Deltaproteobacteria bacterium]